jgi:predicted O-methyltransferase YrrM
VLPFHLASNYISYLFRSVKLHGVHSPFIFNLYNQVIKHDGHFSAYDSIETLRNKLLGDNREIEVTDFGAGPLSGVKRTRSVKEIARTSAKPAKYGQLLFRIVNHFQPHIIFDLGTSLGITTCYQAEANKEATIYTFEGCPNVASIAQENFKALGLNRIHTVIGNLDETLSLQLSKIDTLDYAFFDGNHRYEPTMRYFESCLAKHHEGSVFVIDDLYWSAEMKKAWEEIKKHPKVLQTVDLFFIGLVFFRTSQPKENFTLFY